MMEWLLLHVKSNSVNEEKSNYVFQTQNPETILIFQLIMEGFKY